MLAIAALLLGCSKPVPERGRFGKGSERGRFGKGSERGRFGKGSERGRFGKGSERGRFGKGSVRGIVIFREQALAAITASPSVSRFQYASRCRAWFPKSPCPTPPASKRIGLKTCGAAQEDLFICKLRNGRWSWRMGKAGEKSERWSLKDVYDSIFLTERKP
jgi:DNA-binding transcriptional regulator of glucitol operon